jgi:hypothetical protein
MKGNAVKPRNPLIYAVPAFLDAAAFGIATAIVANSGRTIDVLIALTLLVLATSDAFVMAILMSTHR